MPGYRGTFAVKTDMAAAFRDPDFYITGLAIGDVAVGFHRYPWIVFGMDHQERNTDICQDVHTK